MSNTSNSNVNANVTIVSKSGLQKVPQNEIADTANIISTSYKGKAFVPQNITNLNNQNSYNSIENIIGPTRKNRYRHLYDGYANYTESQGYDAAYAWLYNGATQTTFTRILGAGNCLSSSTKNFDNAGFNVSKDFSSGSLYGITKSRNVQAAENGICGTTNFFISKMENIDEIEYMEDLGLTGENYFINNIIVCASGVLPRPINTDIVDASLSLSTIATFSDDAVDFDDDNNNSFKSRGDYIRLFGLKSKEDKEGDTQKTTQNILFNNDKTKITKTIVYNEAKSNLEPARRLNYFPEKLNEKGHFVYASFASPYLKDVENVNKETYILTARKYSDVLNQTSETVPDYNSFENKFETSRTPWITSQPRERTGLSNNRENIHKNVDNLFRFWAVDDGEVGNRFRIKINITHRGDYSKNIYSRFDVYIFEYDPRNNSFKLLEELDRLCLNPDDPRYIGRVFGTENTYYDFVSQKVVTEGKYLQNNNYLRVEVNEDIENKKISPDVIPSGFRGYPYLNINKDVFNSYDGNSIASLDFDNLYSMPVHYTNKFYNETNANSSFNTLPMRNSWGTLFYYPENNIFNPKSKDISPHFYHTKYFLSNQEDSKKNVWILDDTKDEYLNSFFHIEKISYDSTKFDPNISITNTNKISKEDLLYYRKADVKANRSYINLDRIKLKNGKPKRNAEGDVEYCYWETDYTLIQGLRDMISFDFFTYGGFDGVDIRDTDKRFMKNNAVLRELNGEDSSIPKSENPTYSSYVTAIESSINDESFVSDILVAPGIREQNLIRKYIDICEENKKSITISDILGTVSHLDDYRVLGDYISVASQIEGSDNYFVDDIKVISDNTSREFSNIYNTSDYTITINKYKKSLENAFSSVLDNFITAGLSSRYFMPVYGEFISIDKDLLDLKVLCPSIIALGKMARSQVGNISGNIFNIFPDRILELIDNKNLNLRSDKWDSNSKILRESKINVFYETNSSDAISLYSTKTTHDKRNSVFADISTIKALNIVKKELMWNLFTNTGLVSSGILFAQNANITNLYEKLKIQLRIKLDEFVQRNIIADYSIKIDPPTDENVYLDLENYIIRGNIDIIFNNSEKSSIISINMNNILQDLSLLLDPNSNEIEIPEISLK